jgi:hypothetical protein
MPVIALVPVPQPVDGFEGIGYLAEVFVAIQAVVVVLFVATVFRTLSQGARQQYLTRGRYVWASLGAYVLSVICGFECAGLALTDDFRRTAIMVSIGTIFALISLVTATYARGAGRIPAIVSSVFLMVLWVPMFLGRVLNR